MLATVAAADSAKVQKKSTAFLYIAKRNHTLCTLYVNTRTLCVLQYLHNLGSPSTNYVLHSNFSLKDYPKHLSAAEAAV